MMKQLKRLIALGVCMGMLTQMCGAVLAKPTVPIHSYNPIFRTDDQGTRLFTADPAVLVDGDTLYVYVGQDEARIGGWFNINQWGCFSTQDMLHWTYEGVVLKCSDITWGTPGTAWACHVTKKQGKYYFYSTTGQPDRKGLTVGVMVSDSPTGPFVDVKGGPLFDNAITTGGPVDGMEDIDPTVFVDDDGQGYIYWGNGKLHYALLADDMMSLKDLNGDGQITEGQDVFTNIRIQNQVGPYGEAPWLYKANDRYYLVYASELPQYVRYAMSDSPTGPWQYGGVILNPNRDPDGKDGTYNAATCHPAVIAFKGQSYVFYHNAALPTGGQTRRSVCVEKMVYHADGTIALSPSTSTGLTGTPVWIRQGDRCVTHSGYDLTLDRVTPGDLESAWEIVAGLASESPTDAVSIQSVLHPGHYLTVQEDRVVLAKHDNTAGFKTRATFKQIPGLSNTDGVSFQWGQNPIQCIQLSSTGDRLMVHPVSEDSNSADQQAATFMIQ